MKDTKVQHLTRRYLRRLVAEAPETPEAPETTPAPAAVAKVTPARMIDLIVFCVAVDTYRTFLEGKGGKPDTHLGKGFTLLRRFFPELEAGLQQYIFPLGDRSDAGMIRSLLHKAQRTGTPQVVLPYQVAFFQTLLPWMRQRGTVLTDTFPGRATKAARDAALAVQESSPAALLNRLAQITPTSGLTTLRKWSEAAASASGIPVTEEESIRVDTQVASAIGEDLNQVEAKISNVPPNTPEAAQLQDTRTTLLKQLHTTAEASADKSAVRAAAHTVTPASTSSETRQYATEIGKQIKATGEQEDAMMVRGRALLAAGAGSGKTRVLAAKVVWHINDLGVDPSSIVATTFTRKASKELIDRIMSDAERLIRGRLVGLL